MKNPFRSDASDPLQPGNALKDGNFDSAFVLLNGMAVTLALVIFAMAYLFFL
jgi:hypothetical protein